MPTPPADVAHLLRRAGFGGSAARIAELSALDRPALVDAVLSTTASPSDAAPASTGNALIAEWTQTQDLSTWWLKRMITSPTPIVEKMTLFWHGHFASSQDKVNRTLYLYRQNHTYRVNALGSFKYLAHQMAIQPAMLSYLDNDANVKGAPNQNFARELMELFLLGVGNYSEDDVIASARAWTGHGINDNTKTYQFNGMQHDYELKTFFGTTKAWDGPEIIDEILTNTLKRVIAARFITRKLWTFFAYANPSDTIVNTLAATFWTSGFSITALLRALFLRDEFWSTTARQALVRSPIEYVVNIMRQMGLTPEEANPEWHLRDMGQQLFYPPNVSGWKPNGYWLSTSSASARAEFAQRVAFVLYGKGSLNGLWVSYPGFAVNQVLDLAGISDASANTKKVLLDYGNAQKARATWPMRTGLCALALLSPESQLA